MGSDDGSLSFSDSEGSYKPSLASDSGPEDEELEADTDDDMNRSTHKKRKSVVALQKPNHHANSKQNARGETKVCLDVFLQVFCLY